MFYFLFGSLIILPLLRRLLTTQPCSTSCPCICTNLSFYLALTIIIAYTFARWYIVKNQSVAATLGTYGGHVGCSGIFVSGRSESDIYTHELASYVESFSVGILFSTRFVGEASYTWLSCDVLLICSAPVFTYNPLTGCTYDGDWFRMLGLQDACPDCPVYERTDNVVLEQIEIPRGYDSEARTGNAYISSYFDYVDDPDSYAADDYQPDVTDLAAGLYYNGTIIGEYYNSDRGVTNETKLMSWSMTKTICTLFLGTQINKGIINLNTTSSYVDFTMRDLLAMHTQDPFPEETFDVGMPGENENMLFRSVDSIEYIDETMGGFAENDYLGYPSDEPGYYYSTGQTMLVSAALREAFDTDIEYWSALYNDLLDAIGCDCIVETDKAGNYYLGSFAHCTLESWLRIGKLILQDGVWEGVRILPEGFVEIMRSPYDEDCDCPEDLGVGNAGKYCQYGMGVWTSDFYEGLPQCEMQGHEGQSTRMNFEKQAVAVRIGYTFDDDRGLTYDFMNFLPDGDAASDTSNPDFVASTCT